MNSELSLHRGKKGIKKTDVGCIFLILFLNAISCYLHMEKGHRIQDRQPYK